VIPQCIVGCVLVILGMMVAFGLVRMAADLFIFLIGCAAFAVALHCIVTGVWVGWPQVAVGSFAIGVAGAALSLPALPFSSHYKRK